MILCYTVQLVIPNLCTKFNKVYTKSKDPGFNRSGEICDKILLERKKNEEIKGLISNTSMWLFLCYTIQRVIPNLSTKFPNPKSSFAEKTLTEDFHMHYIGVRD